MHDEKINNPGAFYHLLFGDELYRIRPKKGYANSVESTGNAVSEPGSTYSSLQNYFTGTPSQTLVLTDYPGGDNIPPEDKALLDQILRAIGLSTEKVSILNTAKLPEDVNWEAIAAQSPSEFVIAFGVGKLFIPSGIEEGQIYNINNKRVLCSASLDDLSANASRKKILWQGLKEIYGI